MAQLTVLASWATQLYLAGLTEAQIMAGDADLEQPYFSTLLRRINAGNAAVAAADDRAVRAHDLLQQQLPPGIQLPHIDQQGDTLEAAARSMATDHKNYAFWGLMAHATHFIQQVRSQMADHSHCD
jgi:hypothetical protein